MAPAGKKPKPGPGQVDLFGGRTVPSLPPPPILVDDPTQSRHIVLPGAELWYEPRFIQSDEALEFFNELKMLKYDQQKIKIYGKVMDLPRETAWYGDPGCQYKYSGIRMEPRPWIPVVQQIRQRVEGWTGARFNSVLLNYYHDGKHNVALHADDEPELGDRPVIASVSLGCVRRFKMRCKHPEDDIFRDSAREVHFNLAIGSLLIMGGDTQKYWNHEVPKEPKIKDSRINLTFRRVMS